MAKEKHWTEEEVLELMETKFNDMPMSKARLEAEKWIIDHNGWLPDENKADFKQVFKEINKGIRSEEEKEKKKRKSPEKNPEKVEFIKNLAENLTNMVENVIIVNEQKEITFNIGENHYSLSLILHRPPKEK